jgi:DNA helicase-2/ATP-dependent DNA helicase PcrA
MVGMENGIFPGMSSLNNFTEMEESRRLCYVAITRAEEKLYITSAETRMVFGRNVSYAASDFISEISPGLKENVGGAKNRTVQVLKKNKNMDAQNNPHSLRSSINTEGKVSVKEYISITSQGANQGQQSKSINNVNSVSAINNQGATKSEAKVGRKVRHSNFGIGTIVSISNSNGDTLVSIAFDNMGIKKLILDKSPLEML